MIVIHKVKTVEQGSFLLSLLKFWQQKTKAENPVELSQVMEEY